MPSTINIGIITKIDARKQYSEFDSYDEILKQYDCISINDEELHDLMQETYEKKLSASYCTLDNKHDYGIDQCGVTLIPPSSIEKLLDILKSNINYVKAPWYNALFEKCKKAFDENMYMVFFGI